MRTEINDVLHLILDQAQTLYNQRDLFAIEGNELIQLTLRVSCDLTSMMMVEDTCVDDDGQEVDCGYETKKEDQRFHHIYFNRHGDIWFLPDADMFPVLEGQFPFEVDDNDRRRGSRRYYFSDVIEHDIMTLYQKLDAQDPITRIYTWGGVQPRRVKLTEEQRDMLYDPNTRLMRQYLAGLAKHTA